MSELLRVILIVLSIVTISALIIMSVSYYPGQPKLKCHDKIVNSINYSITRTEQISPNSRLNKYYIDDHLSFYSYEVIINFTIISANLRYNCLYECDSHLDCDYLELICEEPFVFIKNNFIFENKDNNIIIRLYDNNDMIEFNNNGNKTAIITVKVTKSHIFIRKICEEVVE